MRIVKFTSVALAVGLAAALPSTGFAQQQTDAADNTDNATNAANEIICRREPPPVGSRIGARRICKTRLEWDRIRDEARQTLQDAQIGAQPGNE